VALNKENKMSLMNEIREKQIQARKEKSEFASLYTTLLGEAALVGKNAGNRETTDQEVIGVVKKFIKNIDEMLVALTSRLDVNNVAISNAKFEKILLEQFLPKQLSEDELKDLATGRESLPDSMKYLKEHYPGLYDGKLSSAVAKSVFN